MQQIDSSFDEKDVGKAKFSVFVSEAAKRGLLSINKLENGQLEVDVPRPASENGQATPPATPEAAAAAAAAAVAPDSPPGESEEADRGRRGGRRGRGRGRDDRIPRSAAAPSVAPAEAAAEPAAAPQAAAPQPAVPSRRPEAPRQSAPRSADTEIGATGLRLTRDEAFDLVRRAVASVATGDKAAPASNVRAVARSLLGRDSESLSERNFTRILHDAHDADVVDLRRRGSDYEVAPSVAAAPVDRQLADAATANAPVVVPSAPAPRGMGARGSGRGSMGMKGAPPANLLSVGVVAPRVNEPAATPASAAPTNTAKPAGDNDAVVAVEESLAKKPAAARKRLAAKKAAAKPTVAAKAPAARAAKKKVARKKSAKTSAGSQGS